MFMVQRVRVTLEDDIDGSPAVETVSFALDGAAYEIDLSRPHAQTLRDALSIWRSHGRHTGAAARHEAAKSKAVTACSAAPAAVVADRAPFNIR